MKSKDIYSIKNYELYLFLSNLANPFYNYGKKR